MQKSGAFFSFIYRDWKRIEGGFIPWARIIFKRFHLKNLEGPQLFDLICDKQEFDEDYFQFMIDLNRVEL